MKWSLLLLAAFSFSLYAGQLNGEFKNQELVKLFTEPQTELLNPHCIAYSIRKNIENHDLRLAAGQYIDRADLEDVFFEKPGNPGTYIKLLQVNLTYKDKQGNDVYNHLLKCIYKYE